MTKINQSNLFSEEQLDAMVANRDGKIMIKTTDRNGNTFYRPDNRKTISYFEEQARKIWGDRYDYTDSVYTHGKEPIVIYCPKHDYHFRVAMAQNHIMKPHGTFKPTGCPVCRAEELHKCEYGKDWRKYLKVCAKNNRVGRIVQPPKHHYMTPEQRAAKELARQARAEDNRREEQAYMEKWQAKSLKEAHFKERVYQMYGDQYDMALVDYKGREKPVTLICRHHGLFEIAPRLLLNGSSKHKPHGCWKCEGMTDPRERMKLTPTMFNQRMKYLYGTKGLTFPIKRKIKPTTKVTAICMRHGNVTHNAQYWLDGKGCEYCNGKYHPVDCFDNCRKVHGDKYEYVGDPPKVSSGLIQYICPKHGLQKQKYYIHVGLKCGCPQCANYPNKKTPQQRCDEWIKKCIEKYGEGRYDYSRAHEDYVNNDSLVWIRCCIHDYWFQQTPDNNLRTVNGSCPICSLDLCESEGEATIRRWLQRHGILDFEQEYQLPNEDPTLPLQYLSADFYLLHGCEYIIIEYHGEQHYKDIPHFYEGRVRNFTVQQHRDRYLRRYCHDNGIRLIEIPYWDFKRIDEILTEELLNGNVNELTNHSAMPYENK